MDRRVRVRVAENEPVRLEDSALELAADRLRRALQELGRRVDGQPLPLRSVPGELVTDDLARDLAELGLDRAHESPPFVRTASSDAQ
jgi:hypothetical protein